MTYQDAVSDLVRLWELLPLLVGPPWRELEPSLLDALERLIAADTGDDREQRAGQLLRLCLPYEPLRRALEPAVRRDSNRSGQAESASWAESTREVTTVIERSSRPGGDQWLAARLEDHVVGEPLHVGLRYVLTIGVAGDPPSAEALAAEPVPPWVDQSPGADSTPLTVDVRGDADIETINSVVTLPRCGASPDLARFHVTPRAGAELLTLSAVVTQGRLFIQVLTLTVRISGPDAAAEPAGGLPARLEVRSRASGRPLGESFSPDRPDATLVMMDGVLVLTGPYSGQARLPFSQRTLEEIAEVPRTALQEIAHGVLEKDGPAHQASIAVSQEVYETSLTALVRAGTLMFRSLFHGPDATEEMMNLGRMLQHLAAHDGPLWLEVAADTPIVPWHLLALPDISDPAAAEASHILGLEHRITYLPMRRSARRLPPSRSLRADDGPLRVVLAVNRDIDELDGARRDLVESQLVAWQQRADRAGGALDVTVVPGREVFDVLVHNMPPAELLYFYCHASADPNPARLGSMAVCLQFTGGYTLSLQDLILGGPADHELDAAPLIVLNACASAVPASSIYGSFLPHLLGRGARGVIGTEADVPPVFAAVWAKEFFQRVLDGVPLAVAAFEITRDLVKRYRNLLGLVYALHCDGRNVVQPAIPQEPRAPVTET